MRTLPPGTLPRAVEEAIRRRMGSEPVIVLAGARTAGKSTVLQRLAASLDTAVLDLDDLATREAVAADPGYFATGPAPVLVDEFQHVTELLDAIKAELNRDLSPGRFVLTGSTRYLTLPATAQSLTGRVHVLDLWPFSQGELDEVREDFFQALLTDPRALASRALFRTGRDEYAERILSGGMPLPLRRETAVARSRWFRDYATLVVERDVLDLRRVRQRAVLPKLLGCLVAQTGQILNLAKAAREAGEGLAPSVAETYTRLLEAVFLVHRLPAWGRTLRSRVVAMPKLHVVDAGVGAHLLGLTSERLALRDPIALTGFGHLAESFAVNEIMKQASWSDLEIRFGHFRTHDGEEVDLLLETPDGRVAAIEVKAASRIQDRDLKGLRMLRRYLGGKFTGGVVLYLGERSYLADDRIHAVPMDRLWAGAPSSRASGQSRNSNGTTT